MQDRPEYVERPVMQERDEARARVADLGAQLDDASDGIHILIDQRDALCARVAELEADKTRILDALGNGTDEYVWVPGMSWVDAA
jgi:chromosome segregation ATPase